MAWEIPLYQHHAGEKTAGSCEKQGFRRAYVEKHFFRDNYPGVTFDEGELDDMYYLARPLR